MGANRGFSRFGLGLGLTSLAVVWVVACSNSGGNGGDDDSPGQADAAPQDNFCGSCAPPNLCCDTPTGQFCIAVQDDLQNCGQCGNACDPQTANDCSGAQCKCNFGPACTNGETCCGGSGDGCTNLMNDPLNCGECGNDCGPNGTCTNGQCTCNGQVCGAGESCCNGACVDTKADEANCGQCGMACSLTGGECINGGCGCPGGTGAAACPTQSGGPLQKLITECCGAECVDICANMNHCGGCGKACPAGLFCAVGGCVDLLGTNPDAGTPPLPACNILSP